MDPGLAAASEALNSCQDIGTTLGRAQPSCATRALHCSHQHTAAPASISTEAPRAPVPALHRLHGTKPDPTAQADSRTPLAATVPMSCAPERCCTRGCSSKDHRMELELDSMILVGPFQCMSLSPRPVAQICSSAAWQGMFHSQLPGRCPARERQSSLPLAPQALP